MPPPPPPGGSDEGGEAPRELLDEGTGDALGGLTRSLLLGVSPSASSLYGLPASEPPSMSMAGLCSADDQVAAAAVVAGVIAVTGGAAFTMEKNVWRDSVLEGKGDRSSSEASSHPSW